MITAYRRLLTTGAIAIAIGLAAALRPVTPSGGCSVTSMPQGVAVAGSCTAATVSPDLVAGIVVAFLAFELLQLLIWSARAIRTR